jgi:hypothetical protein
MLPNSSIDECEVVAVGAEVAQQLVQPFDSGTNTRDAAACAG